MRIGSSYFFWSCRYILYTVLIRKFNAQLLSNFNVVLQRAKKLTRRKLPLRACVRIQEDRVEKAKNRLKMMSEDGHNNCFFVLLLLSCKVLFIALFQHQEGHLLQDGTDSSLQTRRQQQQQQQQDQQQKQTIWLHLARHSLSVLDAIGGRKSSLSRTFKNSFLVLSKMPKLVSCHQIPRQWRIRVIDK